MTKKTTPLKKVLLITQYYPPEIGGGAHRSSGIAEGLLALGVDVTVIAPFPTYLLQEHHKSFSWKLWEKQNVRGVKVLRTFVISSDRGSLPKRLIYYFSFMKSAFITALFKVKGVDVIITISPPLFTGITGVLLKNIMRTKLIFDIGDLWPESVIQLGFIKNKTAIKIAEALERWIYKRSDVLNLVTEGTRERVLRIHPYVKNTFYVPNFADTKSVFKESKNADLVKELGLENKIVFGYAGNIGGAQGLFVVTEAAKILKSDESIVFLIIGDGVDSGKLYKDIKMFDLHNIIFLPPVLKEEVRKYSSLFDFTVIPLLSNELFLITIPSKLYESMASETPVILCVDGEARKILEDAQAGYSVNSENIPLLAETIKKAASDMDAAAEMGKRGRETVKKYFDRDLVIAKLKQDIENIL